MKHIRFIILAIISIFAISAVANPKIDKIVKELEKMKSVDVTYSEKRNPSTKDIAYATYLIKFSNTSKAKELLEIFKKERENSVEATKTKDTYTITFITNDVKSTYVLIEKENGNWILSIVRQHLGYHLSETQQYNNNNNEYDDALAMQSRINFILQDVNQRFENLDFATDDFNSIMNDINMRIMRIEDTCREFLE